MYPHLGASGSHYANGGVMYRLLMRAFPGWYEPNSVYALYPFMTPAKNREVFEEYGRADTLDLRGPNLPGRLWLLRVGKGWLSC
ncbi:hypothetical protein BDW66DRAFT_138959 [Aspergillus desertorum]